MHFSVNDDGYQGERGTGRGFDRLSRKSVSGIEYRLEDLYHCDVFRSDVICYLPHHIGKFSLKYSNHSFIRLVTNSLILSKIEKVLGSFIVSTFCAAVTLDFSNFGQTSFHVLPILLSSPIWNF